MIKILLKLIFFVLILTLFSCVDNSSYSENSIRVTLAEVSSIGGYSWFQPRFDEYKPKSDIVELIKQNFDKTHHKFYIFAKPACSCEPSHSRFPYCLKVLIEAGVDTSYIEIYSLLKVSSKHLYCSYLIIRDLPSMFVVKDGVPVYSVIDSLLNDQHYIDTVLLVEDYILKALKK